MAAGIDVAQRRRVALVAIRSVVTLPNGTRGCASAGRRRLPPDQGTEPKTSLSECSRERRSCCLWPPIRSPVCPIGNAHRLPERPRSAPGTRHRFKHVTCCLLPAICSIITNMTASRRGTCMARPSRQGGKQDVQIVSAFASAAAPRQVRGPRRRAERWASVCFRAARGNDSPGACLGSRLRREPGV